MYIRCRVIGTVFLHAGHDCPPRIRAQEAPGDPFGAPGLYKKCGQMLVSSPVPACSKFEGE